MALNRPFRFGPIALTTTYTTNILSPGTLTGGVIPISAAASTWASVTDTMVLLVYHIRITNKNAGNSSYRLFIGASATAAAGTEFMGYDNVVSANSYVDWNGRLFMMSGDFLVGGAADATRLTIEGEGEVGVG